MSIPIVGVDAIAEAVFGGLDELFTSDEERAKAKLALTAELQKPHIMQAMTNLEEAKHSSVFVAGWRPALGWICATGIGYSFIIQPLAVLVATLTGYTGPFPDLDTGVLIGLVTTLLGVAGLRTFEKHQGVARGSFKEPTGIY